MKSIGFGNPGNHNLKGKKSARYADCTIQNFKELELIKQKEKEIQDESDRISKSLHSSR